MEVGYFGVSAGGFDGFLCRDICFTPLPFILRSEVVFQFVLVSWGFYLPDLFD